MAEKAARQLPLDAHVVYVGEDTAWAWSLSRGLSEQELRVGMLLEALPDGGGPLVVLWSNATARSTFLQTEMAKSVESELRPVLLIVLGAATLIRNIPLPLARRQTLMIGAEAYAAGPDAGSAEWRRTIDRAAEIVMSWSAEVTGVLPSFSGSARRALTCASTMLDGGPIDPSRLRTAALLGALFESATHGMTPATGDIVRLALQRQEGRRSVEATLAGAAMAAGLQPIPARIEDPLPIVSLASSNVGSLVREAAEIHQRTDSDGVHLRHVLAAGVHPAAAPEALGELGITLAEMRAALRASIEKTWPAEWAHGWDEVLQVTDFGKVIPAAPPSARVHADRWTVEDRLDYALYAKAIAEFIRHPDARPPMVISVQGPWGQGKTSLMRMVQRDLDPSHPDLQNGPAAAADAVVPASELTFGELRQALDGSMAVPDTKPKEIRTVWFNAWKYQSSEQIWAGLAHALLAQLPARLPPRDRELFWLRLQLRRIDPAAVREDIHKATLEKFFPMLLSWAALIFGAAVAGGLVLLVGGLHTIGVATVGAGGVAAALALRGAWARATRQALGRHLEGAYLRYVHQPDYTGRLGYLHLVEEDMRRALKLLTPDDQPAVIFIDDLDRCSPAKIGEVIEAVNLFLAGDYPNCAFVIGIDAEVIAASMEVLHAGIIDKLHDRKGELGWRFMDKFVQLPFVMPRLHPTQREAYLRGLFATPKAGEAREIAAEAERLKSEIDQRRLPVDELARRVGQLAPSLAAVDPDRARTLGEDVVAAGASQFSDNDPEVIQALAEQLRYLSDNPRTIKRAVNLYRFHRFAAFARQASTLPLEVATPEQIGRWIVVIIRWPHFVRWLQAQRDEGASPGQDPAKRIVELATRAETSAAFAKALSQDGIHASWVDDQELWEFLHAKVEPDLKVDLAGARGLW